MGVSDIARRREAGLVRVEGVTHRWVWHSPAGFEWGGGRIEAAKISERIGECRPDRGEMQTRAS